MLTVRHAPPVPLRLLLAPVVTCHGRLACADVPTHRLLYRRRIYVPVGAFAAEVDKAGTDGEEGMAALRLEFKEAQYNTLQGNYPVDEPTAMRLMALVVRMELGAWASDKVAKNEVRDMLDAHVPPLIMKGKNKKAKTKMEGCVGGLLSRAAVPVASPHPCHADACVTAQLRGCAVEAACVQDRGGPHEVIRRHAQGAVPVLLRKLLLQSHGEWRSTLGVPCSGASLWCSRPRLVQCNRPITDKLRTINVGVGFNGISLFITRRGVLAPVEEYKCVPASHGGSVVWSDAAITHPPPLARYPATRPGTRTSSSGLC